MSTLSARRCQLVPGMVDKGGGAIVNVSSVAADKAVVGATA
ncbi:hypothetical protein ACGF13_39915 [Kitasatospora sp. NPDC048286]